jgi:hypothetical protein
MMTIEFVTRPSVSIDEVEVVLTRTKWKLDVGFIGFIPLPVVRTEDVPYATTKYAGRHNTEPFWVRNWPHPLGVKIDKIEIEGVKLEGVFAFEHDTEKNIHRCCFDYMP